MADSKIVIEIERKGNPLRELFGALKFREPTEKLLKEIRRKESKHL